MLKAGIDVVKVRRIQEVAARHGERFLRRVFTAAELSLCQRRKNPWPCLAARWAAKEAVLKALGVGPGRLAWVDIEIVKEDGGRPRVELSAPLLRLMGEHGLSVIEVSLSHEKDLAVAVAVIYGGPPVSRP